MIKNTLTLNPLHVVYLRRCWEGLTVDPLLEFSNDLNGHSSFNDTSVTDTVDVQFHVVALHPHYITYIALLLSLCLSFE